MSDNAMKSLFPAVRRHVIDIHRERQWPWQWIGMCSCGAGIRCNHKAEAKVFFERQGCVSA